MSRIVELPNFYADLTPHYLEKRKKDLVSLKANLAEGDMERIQKIAHKIAGSGGSYGLPEVSKMGKEVELAAVAGEYIKLKELLDRFLTYLEDIEVVFRD